MARTNLLILDDWIRDPITLQNAQDLLEILDDRFGHTSTLITSQVPVAEWHRRIPDPTIADALTDRIVHNITPIELNLKEIRKGRSERRVVEIKGQ